MSGMPVPPSSITGGGYLVSRRVISANVTVFPGCLVPSLGERNPGSPPASNVPHNTRNGIPVPIETELARTKPEGLVYPSPGLRERSARYPGRRSPPPTQL